jgi:superfamily II DNA/RNA helicase
MKVLNVNDPVEITLSQNKSNIKLIVKKVSNSVEMALLWLIDGLVKLKDEFPKILVYCNSIKDASMIRQYILIVSLTWKCSTPNLQTRPKTE